jgi:hypothetical protein
MRKNKATGKLMTRQEKIDYVTKWKIKNKHILEEGGSSRQKEEMQHILLLH